MAIARVQFANGSIVGTAGSGTYVPVASSYTCTLGTIPVNGNNLVAVIGVGASDATGQVSFVSSTNAVWSRLTQYQDATTGLTLESWGASVGASAGRIVTIGIANVSCCVIAEYSGGLDTSGYDVTHNNNHLADGTPDTGSTSTTSFVSELWISGYFLFAENSPPSSFVANTLSSPTNGYALVDQTASTFTQAGNYRDGWRIGLCDKIVTSTGTAGNAVTANTSGQSPDWVASAVAIKALSQPAGSSNPNRLPLLGCG